MTENRQAEESARIALTTALFAKFALAELAPEHKVARSALLKAKMDNLLIAIEALPGELIISLGRKTLDLGLTDRVTWPLLCHSCTDRQSKI